MGEISDTIVETTEFSGDFKLQVVTATLASEDDTIVLTESANEIKEIVYAKAHLTGGVDAELCWLQTSWSSLTIQIKSFEAGGTVATNFTGATVEVLVIGK